MLTDVDELSSNLSSIPDLKHIAIRQPERPKFLKVSLPILN